MDCWGLKLVLYHYTAHLVSSRKDHSLQFKSFTAFWAKIQPVSISYNLTHTSSLLEIQTVSNKLETHVLANPDKAPNFKAGMTVPVRNGINSANAGKNPPFYFHVVG